MGVEGARVAVVIPAYQAAGTIERVLGGTPAWVDAIYVIDDGSSDETGARVRAVADTRVRLLVSDVNRGVGAAMVTGYLQALAEGMDICVKMDADDQMDPTYLPELVEPLIAGRADYAKGNRFHDTDALRQMPLVRKVGNVGLSFLIKAASGQWQVFDPTNGYTAIHRAALDALDLRKVHPRYFFESSMLILLRRAGAVVEDVTMPARYVGGLSHLSVARTIFEFPWLLVRQGVRRILWQYFVADFNAVSLMLLCGLPLVTYGVLFGLYHWIESYVTNRLTPAGTIMLTALPLILGFQLLLQALVLDVQNLPRRPLQARRRRPLAEFAEHAAVRPSVTGERAGPASPPGPLSGERVLPAEAERLRAEADYLHRALFGRGAPAQVQQQYAEVMCRAPLAEIPRCNVARLVERRVDLEAMEMALRRKRPVNSLTQRFQTLCYLVEVRPAYFDRFVNEGPALAAGLLTLSLQTLRSLYKLAKGSLLLRIHDDS